MASNKKLEDLLRYNPADAADAYEDVCKIIEKVAKTFHLKLIAIL